jgi:hypothetical protein
MNIVQRLGNAVTRLIGMINWKLTNSLTEQEINEISALCVPNYYIILTRNNNHLSAYAINIADLFLTGKFGYWAHALMNMEDTVVNDIDFRFVQAIGTGVEYTTLDKVTAVNSIVLLSPKNMPIEQWTAVLDKAKSQMGKKYDTLFDMKDDTKVSCVELVRLALMADPNYATNFAHFEAMVQKNNRLTPQMFYDCPDFKVVYEVRR